MLALKEVSYNKRNLSFFASPSWTKVIAIKNIFLYSLRSFFDKITHAFFEVSDKYPQKLKRKSKIVMINGKIDLILFETKMRWHL